MWYPAKVTTPGTEPVTRSQAKEQLSILDEETQFDAKIDRLIAVARDVVETRCGVRFSQKTVVAKCDAFADMARLPEAPVASITTIEYVDAEGATQTVSDTVYELRADGLEAAVVLKDGQEWPSAKLGRRITLTAVVGYESAPPAVVHAMLVHIADTFHQRESVKAGDFTTIDALLCNHKRAAS